MLNIAIEVLPKDMSSDSKDVIGQDLEDFIVCLYRGGFLHVLDRIFLGLQLDDIRACKRVNRLWSEIVEYYRKSDIPRIRKIFKRIIAVAIAVSKPIYSLFHRFRPGKRDYKQI